MEQPPARERTKSRGGATEHQVVLVQASEYLQTRRTMPDFITWTQCFSLYSAVLLTRYLERATSLLLYQATITKLSQKFKWPSWVVYDDSFRQEAAETNKTDRSKIDASLHAKCFTAAMAEGWCSICHSVEHLKQSCPLRPQTRRPPWQHTAGSKASFKRPPAPICKKFNRGDGQCDFGPRCNYQHICRKCFGEHPETRCKAGQRLA